MRVLVGMSGGVDSSVAAALLLEQGYDVAGCTLRLYDGEEYEAGQTRTCCSLSDVEDARSVCAKLGIPHYVFNFKQQFRSCVIDNFISEYINGRTPNPCIECNKSIKFSEMLLRAETLGYDKIATGHYAFTKQAENGSWLLFRGSDRTKDQSYVLYCMTQHQLSKTLFPLADVSKETVRRIASRYGFFNAEKPDSQDICFVPDGDYAAFIERDTGKNAPPGYFSDEQGNVLGRHSGLIRYTVGQRKGLGIALGAPAFVVSKDAGNNRVILSTDERRLFYKRVLISSVNFIPGPAPDEPLRVTAKLRYRHNDSPATLYSAGTGSAVLEFDEPQRAPSPGQAAVFYSGDRVLGGGTIERGLNDDE